MKSSQRLGKLSIAITCAIAAFTCHEAFAQLCKPVSQRTGELGCWITANAILGQLPQQPIFWHLDAYPTRGAAEAAKGPRGTVMESLGKVWLLTIEVAGWRPAGACRACRLPGRLAPTCQR